MTIQNRRIPNIFLLFLAGLVLVGISIFWKTHMVKPEHFNGARALKDVQTQVNFGPRIPGSVSQSAFINWLRHELQESGWQVEIQKTSYQGKPIQNVIASKGTGAHWLLLGAHYDSRLQSDRDPELAKRLEPVPGANDGASGVAVLLELARVMTVNEHQTIWMVFFDAEDNGRIDDWDWILGSRAFAASLSSKPDAVVIIDMIGDADLTIFKEQNSDPSISQEIWQIAADLGYTQFIPSIKYSILDDHTPFLELGIPAVDIIDFDYAYYHTTQDTADKVSANSLQAVGDTLLTWISQQP